MTRSTTTIPFHDLDFIDRISDLREVEDHLKKFLRRLRKERQDAAHEAGLITEDDVKTSFEMPKDADWAGIRRRAMIYRDRLQASTTI